MGRGGPKPVPMAECLSESGAGAAEMRASGRWSSFASITRGSSAMLERSYSGWAIRRRGVVLLGSFVYALL